MSETTRSDWNNAADEVRARSCGPGLWSKDVLLSHSGIEIFRRMLAGELPYPPIGELLGFIIVEVDVGRVVFQGLPGKQHYNPLGAVHGGYHATLLDSCVACAIQTTLAAGQGYTTLELKVNYVRALTDKAGPVRAEGKVIHVGKQIATAEGRLVDQNGKLYAHASTTCIIFQPQESAQ